MRGQAPQVDFAGWVIVSEYTPGVLLQTDISLAPNGSECEADLVSTPKSFPKYELANPEEVTILCRHHLEQLYANRVTPTASPYIMGALPAN